MKKRGCKGCGGVLANIGQCSRCSRCLECCNRPAVEGSCANKFERKSHVNQRRSIGVYEAHQRKLYVR